MDTRSKSIKYPLASKVVAVTVMWISLVIILVSAGALLVNIDIIQTKSYEDTHGYKATMGRLIHNTVELGTRFKHGRNKELEADRYNTIKHNLSSAVNFNYYIEDLTTGDVSYKIRGYEKPETIKEQASVIHINKDKRFHRFYDYHDIYEMLEESPHELYVLLNDPLVEGDMFYETFKTYTRIKKEIPYMTAGLIISVILFLFSFGYLLFATGKEEKGGRIYLAEIDRIYNDIQSFFVLIAAGISISIVASIGFSAGRYSPEVVIVIIILAIDVAIGMIYFFSMLRQFKKGVLFKNTLIYQIIDKILGFIRACFKQKVFKGWLLILMLAYAFINGMIFSFATKNRYYNFQTGFALLIIFNGMALYFAWKILQSLTMIMDAAKEISNGNLDYSLDESQISMEFLDFAVDIQSIQGGLKHAVSEAIKGEKMKTDLITNVSHDLKTPLTSIINYVDLLKQENIETETAKGYLNILDEKSNRLKQLVEDLIEASKASSGNITITKAKVDLHELIAQVCGEYEEKMKDAQLDLRINTKEKDTWILADGKYMWRILENMMSNVLKYSMPHSRVYMSIEQNKEYGVLVIKNVSASPLDIDPSQLTERFIRADQSRTTEGSGLGLSIAQSLTTIQGGKFNIEIDGDLFKVTIEMPLWAESLEGNKL